MRYFPGSAPGASNPPVRATGYKTLGYANFGRADWRFVDLSEDRPATIGRIYPSKDMLLSDLRAFVAERYGSNEVL